MQCQTESSWGMKCNAERYESQLAALRAELDAANTKSAALEADLQRERNYLVILRDIDNSVITELKAERGEARSAARLATDTILRHAPHMKPVYLTSMITRWDAERPVPDTNRDAGDGFTSYDVNSPERANPRE